MVLHLGRQRCRQQQYGRKAVCTRTLPKLGGGEWNLTAARSKPVVLDFQIVGTGCGIYDLGYFVSQSLTADVRRGHDEELFHRYCDRLESHGIDVDRVEMWRQYRLTVYFCAIYSVTNFPQYGNMNDRGQQLMRDMLQRSLTAVMDVDALSVID